MARNRSSLAQRKRRRNEKKRANQQNEENKESTSRQKKKIKSSPILISISSDSGEHAEDPIQVPSESEEEVCQEDTAPHHYEMEMDKVDAANEMVCFMEDTASDITSDEDDSELDDDIMENFWMLFHGQDQLAEDLSSKQKLKSGKIGYEKPVKNPDPLDQKLVPRALPRQTKFNRKTARIKALGRNNTMMANWLIKSTPKDTTEDNSDSEDSNENIDPQLLDLTPHEQDQPGELKTCLASHLEQYLSAPRVPSKPSVSKDAQAKFKELNDAITLVTKICKDKLKKDSSFKYPTDVLANLHKFKILRRDYTIEGIKSPSHAAALATAKSAIRRSPPSSKSVHRYRSGIYLARTISKQARHLLSHKEILPTQNGNQTNHKSIINDMKIREALFTWASAQSPGQVSAFLQRCFHVFNLCLLNHKFYTCR
jgi:hypothetical protein